MDSGKINLMITGPTGCGKSSTINALFGEEVAKVGITPNPETVEITRYEHDNLVIWDTPGLGDGISADKKHTKNIINKLHERDSNGNLLIDFVLVVIDGGSRDLGTSYELINKVIIPNLGSNKHRILVAVNQADMAMKGRYWNRVNNTPEQKLVDFLNEKVRTIHDRIYEATKVDTEPVYYSAGFKEEGHPQVKPFNIKKLLRCITHGRQKYLLSQGVAYLRGDGVKKNYAKVFECIQAVFDEYKDDLEPSTEFYYSYMLYFKGEENASKEWLKKAAEHGSKKAEEVVRGMNNHLPFPPYKDAIERMN